MDAQRGVGRSQLLRNGEVVKRRQRRPEPPQRRVAVPRRLTYGLECDEGGGVGGERDRALPCTPIAEGFEIAAIGGAGVRRQLCAQPTVERRLLQSCSPSSARYVPCHGPMMTSTAHICQHNHRLTLNIIANIM